MWVIAKIVAVSVLQIIQFIGQVKVSLIPQLICKISRVLWKLLNYFNGAAIYTFAIPALIVLFVNFD